MPEVEPPRREEDLPLELSEEEPDLASISDSLSLLELTIKILLKMIN